MLTEKQKLRIIKYQSKCKELCCKYIEHFRKNKKSYIKCECNDCNSINNFQSSALMKGKIRCSNCLIIKYQSKCNYINDFQSGALMDEDIRCSNCLIIKYQIKCKELYHEYIEHFRKNKKCFIKCECNECNSINDFYSNALMKGKIRCSNCLIIKYQSICKELYSEYIGHSVKNKKTYIKCKCNDCDYYNDFQSSALINNSVKCKCKKKTFKKIYEI